MITTRRDKSSEEAFLKNERQNSIMLGEGSSQDTSEVLLTDEQKRILTEISSRKFLPQTTNVSGAKRRMQLLPEAATLQDKICPLPGNEIVSSLPLQVSLYFNIYFFPFWLASTGLMIWIKYTYLNSTEKMLVFAPAGVLCVLEILRLYLGFVGNLGEQVPSLAGFLLLTLIPQLPILSFFMFNGFLLFLPVEHAVNMVLFVLHSIQFVSALRAIGAMSHKQTIRFHLEQFGDLGHLRDQNIPDHFQDRDTPVTLKKFDNAGRP